MYRLQVYVSEVPRIYQYTFCAQLVVVVVVVVGFVDVVVVLASTGGNTSVVAGQAPVTMER